ncbi:MAG TPA: hypothetical protein VII75_12805 [Thermoanaerobaculia bacterium]|nr:hypothetical protein [Thermoanaerobaculia bacterium]
MEAILDSNPPAPKTNHIFDMLFSPIRTLQSLKEEPRYFSALLIAALYATALSSWIVQHIGLTNILQNTIRATQTIDTQTMLANILRYRTQILWTQAISTFAGTIITAYMIALILWLVVTIAGEEVRLRSINAVVAHVMLFYVAIKYTLFALSVVFNRNAAAVNLKNPLATNAAFFFHANSQLLQHVMRSLDVIVLAAVALIIIGIRAMSPRMSAAVASLVVLIPWSIYIVSVGLLATP